MSLLEALPRLAHAVLQHLFAYGELLHEEGIEAARRLRRGVVGFAVAAAAGFIAAELACLWVIAATWNGPNRLTAVGALCIGFALMAVISGVYAGGTRAGEGRRPFERVRAEWHADMEELAALDPTLTASGESSPEQRVERAREGLQRSRAEIFALAHAFKEDSPNDGEAFPRSRLMRALSGSPGRMLRDGAALAATVLKPSLLWRAGKVAGVLRPILLRYVLPRLLR